MKLTRRILFTAVLVSAILVGTAQSTQAFSLKQYKLIQNTGNYLKQTAVYVYTYPKFQKIDRISKKHVQQGLPENGGQVEKKERYRVKLKTRSQLFGKSK